MATLAGPRKRGRKKEALRTDAAALAASLASLGNRSAVEVPMPEPEPSLWLSVPKGVAVVPFALTVDKSDENVRQQLRNAIADADVDAEVRSVVITFADGTQPTLWLLATPDAGDVDNSAPPKPRKPRK